MGTGKEGSLCSWRFQGLGSAGWIRVPKGSQDRSRWVQATKAPQWTLPCWEMSVAEAAKCLPAPANPLLSPATHTQTLIPTACRAGKHLPLDGSWSQTWSPWGLAVCTGVWNCCQFIYAVHFLFLIVLMISWFGFRDRDEWWEHIHLLPKCKILARTSQVALMSLEDWIISSGKYVWDNLCSLFTHSGHQICLGIVIPEWYWQGCVCAYFSPLCGMGHGPLRSFRGFNESQHLLRHCQSPLSVPFCHCSFLSRTADVW